MPNQSTIAAFIERHHSKLSSIVFHSNGFWDNDDLVSEIQLALLELELDESRKLILGNDEDDASLLRFLRRRANIGSQVFRKADRPDQQGLSDEWEGWGWESFSADEDHHPLSLLEALESQVPEPEPIDPYACEVAAWNWLVRHFDRKMKDVAAFLLISLSWSRVCRRQARHTDEAQQSIPYMPVLENGEDNAIRPWRKFKLPARTVLNHTDQLALDFWNTPAQPAHGQLWLI